MEGTNGIETARILRRTDPDLLLVFVTSSPEYVWDAFPVHPFDYLLKPYREEKLFQLADELLAQMPQDPQCEDIVARAGAKDTYYYSNANMSDNYAMIAQLIEDEDLCAMFAEMVRFNARIYPSATPLRYFRRSPYGLSPEEVEQTWKAMQGKPEFSDIEELTNNQNERFLFSTQYLTRRYAKAISDVDEWTD